MQEDDVLSRALINERALTIEFFKMSGGEQAQMQGISGGEEFLFQLYSISSVKKRDAVLMLDYYADMIAASNVPAERRLEQIAKVEQEYSSYSPVHWLVHQNTHYGRIWQTAAGVEGQLSCAETALAIERYRLKHDDLPESLEMLVGEFIDRVPVDPFDGEPIRYRRLEEGGYAVYMIGKDGIDDGGLDKKQMSQKTGQKRPESHDWPFTVRGRAN